MKEKLEAQGYHPVMEQVDLIETYTNLENPAIATDPYYMNNAFSLMRESDYRKLMSQIGEKAEPVMDDQVLELSSNYSRRKNCCRLTKANDNMCIRWKLAEIAIFSKI